MSDDGDRAHIELRAAVKAAALLHLADLGRVSEVMRVNQLAAVTAAREAGATWNEIGAALGVSRQVAHNRYSGVD